jgi:hypothetical protein
MHPFFNVSGPMSSLMLLRLVDVLKANETEPDLPNDANVKYEAFIKILEVRLISATLSRFLTCHHRRWPTSLCQKVM